MQNKEMMIEKTNSHGPKFIAMMGGQLINFDTDKTACTFEFNISKDFCHSIDIVQGGFVTAMLDAAMESSVLKAG
jgi:acyl-coenzyme A thioesterase PaaI-like protein